MTNSVTHAQSTTFREARKALARCRLYLGLQSRVAARCRVSRTTVSKAAREPRRYSRVALALLRELIQFEPGWRPLIDLLRAQTNGGRR